MKLSIRSLALIPCLGAFLVVSGSALADPIVTNGTFSTTPNGLQGWTVGGTGGTTPGIGLTVVTLGTGNSSTPYGDVIGDASGGTSTAVYFVDDNANESLSQSVTLSANTTYNLTFDVYADQSGSGNQFDFLLSDTLGSVETSTFGDGSQSGATPVPVGTWTTETLSFTTGSATSYNLAFDFTSGPTPAKDLLLTNVALAASPVPEPSSFLLLGTGLFAAAGAVRRRLAA